MEVFVPDGLMGDLIVVCRVIGLIKLSASVAGCAAAEQSFSPTDVCCSVSGPGGRSCRGKKLNCQQFKEKVGSVGTGNDTA